MQTLATLKFKQYYIIDLISYYNMIFGPHLREPSWDETVWLFASFRWAFNGHNVVFDAYV